VKEIRRVVVRHEQLAKHFATLLRMTMIRRWLDDLKNRAILSTPDVSALHLAGS